MAAMGTGGYGRATAAAGPVAERIPPRTLGSDDARSCLECGTRAAAPGDQGADFVKHHNTVG